MTLVTSFFRSRFIAKTLLVGGLASCPLLLSSEVTLAQSVSNYRELSCLYAGYKQPYLYGSTTWSGQPSNNGSWLSVTLYRFKLSYGRYVPIASDGAAGNGASGEIWAITKSPLHFGYFRGDSFFASSYAGEEHFKDDYRLCLP
ncbi:MAG: hypothetical protein WBG73_23115 [Coleofasciculaceae cyanobacterium]